MSYVADKTTINKSASRDVDASTDSNSLQELSAMYLQYYVYAYLRTDGTPYYIGKGKNQRAFEEHRVNNKGIHTPKDTSRIIFLEQNLTNIGALAIERRLIRWYGRKDIGTGILQNRTAGGEGGEDISLEARQKISKANTGKKMSEETKKKISDAKRGKPTSSKTKEKISNAKKGVGQTHSKETCEKISMSKKGKSLSAEHKENIRKARLGKKYVKALV